MGFFDPNAEPLQARRPEGVTTPSPVGPTFMQTLGSAFSQDNTLVNVYSRLRDETFPPDPSHNPLEMIRGTDYEARHLDRFVSSRSKPETFQIMRRIDSEEADQRVLAASGAGGVVAQIAAGTTDPTLFLPGVVAVRSAKTGLSVARTALATGGAVAAQTAAQEAVLHATQETRTLGDSALAVGSGTILGGLIGAGAAKLLTRGESRALAASLDIDRQRIDAHAAGQPSSNVEKTPDLMTPAEFTAAAQRGHLTDGHSDFAPIPREPIAVRGDPNTLIWHQDVALNLGYAPEDIAKLLAKSDAPEDIAAAHAQLQDEARRFGPPQPATQATMRMVDEIKTAETKRPEVSGDQLETLMQRYGVEKVNALTPDEFVRAARTGTIEKMPQVIEAGAAPPTAPGKRNLLGDLMAQQRDEMAMRGGVHPLLAERQSIASLFGRGGESKELRSARREYEQATRDFERLAKEMGLPAQHDESISRGPRYDAATERMDAAYDRIEELLGQNRKVPIDEALTEVAAKDRPEIEQTLTKIIRDQIGDQQVTIKFPDTVNIDDAAHGWGGEFAHVREAAGQFGTRHLNAAHIIEVALEHPEGAQGRARTAFHETFHLIQDALATGDELRILRAEDKRLRDILVKDGRLTRDQVTGLSSHEVQALAYERFALARAAGETVQGLSQKIAALFTRVQEFLRRVANALNGLGYKTSEDVFRTAMSGDMATRQMRPIGRLEAEGMGIGRTAFGMEGAPPTRLVDYVLESLQAGKSPEKIRSSGLPRALRRDFTPEDFGNVMDLLEQRLGAHQQAAAGERGARFQSLMTQQGSELAARSGGAAATDTRQLEMFKTPFDKAGLSNLSVTRRTMMAASTAARRVMADLAEMPYSFRENMAGIATTQGPALDRLARMQMNGTRVEISDTLDRLFSQYRFGQPDITLPRARARVQDLTDGAEGKMSYTDFKREVSLAAQSGDRHLIPEVEQAAQFIRQKLLDPWAERAEKAIDGFQRTTPAEGESYFPHVWNKQLIRARRPEFTNKLVDLYAADQATKRGIQERLRLLADELKKAQDTLAKATTPEDVMRASAAHNDLRTRIEAEIGRWDGKSAQEAKTAIKSRDKAAGPRDADAPRMTGADDTIDRVVNRILKSERDLSVEDLRSRAQQTVDRILGSPDGRLPYDLSTGGPRIGFHDSPMQRGSLASRSLDVSNAWARDWIEHDIEQVVGTHLRTIIPDVLLSERFGDVEMTQAFRTIQETYANLIDASKGEAVRNQLGKERDAVIRDVAAVRDRIRGVYGWSPELANMARVANSAKAINNLTSMGVAAVSSIPDLAGSVFRYGLTTTFRDGWAPFFKGLSSQSEEWGKFKTQMRAIGIGIETAINARQHSLDDVMDVYKPQSRFERTLQAASDKFFVANLLAPLTDAEKLIAAHVAVSEMLRATKAASAGNATAKQIRNLAESGIDIQMAGRIWEQFSNNGGEVTNGVHLPNTAGWADRAAADALSGAVAREVDIMVITPGQEKPLWMSKPVINLLGQFKAFTASATERILVANMQRRDASALSGLVFSLGLGMVSYKLNSFFGGQKTSDRPQDWVKEGISRAGLLGWFEDGNALASKASRGSVDIYRMIGADKPLSRFVSRSAADMLLGPTWGKIEQLPKLSGAAFAGEWSASDTTAVRRLVPFQNLFYLRGLLNQVEAATNDRFNIPAKKEPTKH